MLHREFPPVDAPIVSKELRCMSAGCSRCICGRSAVEDRAAAPAVRLTSYPSDKSASLAGVEGQMSRRRESGLGQG